MSQTNNLLLGSLGTLGQTNTIEIGATQTDAYCAGIYNRPVNTSPQQVVVSASNQLGISPVFGPGEYSFSYYLPANLFQVDGATKPYYLGSSLYSLVASYDNTGGNFYPGAGSSGGGTQASAAYFTAPVTGQYFFNFVVYDYLAMAIDTSQLVNFTFHFYQVASTQYGNYQGFPPNYIQLDSETNMNTIILPLNSGDKVYFAWEKNMSLSGPPPTPPVQPLVNIGGGTSPYETYISGFRVN